MRIAHLTATCPPDWTGSGNIAYQSARVLHERGHEVTLLVAGRGGGYLPTPFPAQRLPASFRLGRAAFTPDLLAKLRDFDLIHLHYPLLFGAELAALAARHHHIPLVLSYHHRPRSAHPASRGMFALYHHLVEPLILASASRILTVSPEHLGRLHPQLASSERVLELPHGVDTRTFRPRPDFDARKILGTPAATPVALSVGSLDGYRRFEKLAGLLRTFADLKLPTAELWIIGDGDRRPLLEATSRKLGLEERVRFLGKHPPSNLPPYYAAADLAVLPPDGGESSGTVLTEALACGTAVIAADLPEARRVVRDGVEGLLVKPGSSGALRRALTALLGDRERAAAMGRAGHRRVVRSYDWDDVAQQLEHYYLEVMAEWSSRRTVAPNSQPL